MHAARSIANSGKIRNITWETNYLIVSQNALGMMGRRKLRSHPLSYTILLEDLLGIKKCPQKHGGSYAISMTTLTLFSW